MPRFNLFDRSLQVLQKSLDLRAQRQQVIASNVANAETPGYQRRSFEFEAQLQRAIDRPQLSYASSNPRHIPLGGGDLHQVDGELVRHQNASDFGDRNNVLVEDEMLSMAQNQLLYEASTKLTQRKLQLLRYAVNDGK